MSDVDGFELSAALNDTMNQAYEANRRARVEGRRAAEARADYKAALASEMARLRADGTPASMAEKLAQGAKRVRDLSIAAEMADVDYQADREEVNLRKREADILREQIQRDYSEARFRA